MIRKLSRCACARRMVEVRNARVRSRVPLVVGVPLAAALVSSHALAAPPLFTEDAETVGAGTLEGEVWAEGIRGPDERFGLGIAELAFGVTDWLDIAVAAGFGLEQGSDYTVPSPYAQVKLALLDGEGKGLPSLGLTALVVPPIGRGIARHDELALGAVVPATFSLRDELLLAHFNLGVTAAVAGDRMARPFWGAAAQLAVFDTPATVFAEVSAGDPFDPIGPRVGGQAGLTWELADTIGRDFGLAVMADPDDSQTYEYLGRVGLSWAIALMTADPAEAR